MSINNERDVNAIEAMTLIAQTILKIDAMGFIESYRSTKPGELIYDSQWCRISLVWGGWDPLEGNSMHIRYGRLHAPSDKTIMLWNGEDCYCWHRIEYLLHFLDGRTPAEAAKLNYSHSIKTKFNENEIRKKFDRRQPEWMAEMHVTIWQNYGNRIFELFDLRQPDVWEKYRQFLKEVYDIKGRSPAIKPSLDKVC